MGTIGWDGGKKEASALLWLKRMSEAIDIYPASALAEPGQRSDPAIEQQEQILRALLGRLSAGDEAALAQFYDLTVGRVYGLALRITGRPDAAEDVAAEVYLQVWREAGRYDIARGRVLAWLLTICRSRAIDSLRRRDEAESSPDPERLQGEDVPVAGDAQDLLDAAERSSALHVALAELSPLQRQLLALAFFRGLTHEEISAHSGLPLGSVKTHIRKALSQLRTRLCTGTMEQIA